MVTLTRALPLLLVLACAKRGEPETQTRTVIVQLGGIVEIVDGVEVQFRGDPTDGILITKPFSMPRVGEFAADLRKYPSRFEGTLTIDGTPCTVTSLFYVTSSIDNVRNKGFTGDCRDAKGPIDFHVGVVAK